MSKTAVATQSDKAELERYAALEAELAAQNQADVDQADIQIPLLKVGQALTREVQDGDASAGEFINSLTREGLGTEIEFIVAGFSKGRFDHGVRGETKARKAYNNPKVVPWNDDPFFGQPFTQHPDAEESYSARVNAGDIQWGKGPRISTTYDFTGFVVPEGEERPIPVCLSLMRGGSKQAKKWLTILDSVLRGRYWDAVFTVTTVREQNEGNTFYGVIVKQARDTTPQEKMYAVELAQVIRNQSVQIVGEQDDPTAKAKPADSGGLEV